MQIRRRLWMVHARAASTRATCCRGRGFLVGEGIVRKKDQVRGTISPGSRDEPQTDVMTCCSPHSSTPKRPSVCAFQEANGRIDLVEVITTNPETSPEYIRSLSPETNNTLIAYLCERIVCSGDGAIGAREASDMRRTYKTYY